MSPAVVDIDDLVLLVLFLVVGGGDAIFEDGVEVGFDVVGVDLLEVVLVALLVAGLDGTHRHDGVVFFVLVVDHDEFVVDQLVVVDQIGFVEVVYIQIGVVELEVFLLELFLVAFGEVVLGIVRHGVCRAPRVGSGESAGREDTHNSPPCNPRRGISPRTMPWRLRCRGYPGPSKWRHPGQRHVEHLHVVDLPRAVELGQRHVEVLIRDHSGVVAHVDEIERTMTFASLLPMSPT